MPESANKRESFIFTQFAENFCAVPSPRAAALLLAVLYLVRRLLQLRLYKLEIFVSDTIFTFFAFAQSFQEGLVTVSGDTVNGDNRAAVYLSTCVIILRYDICARIIRRTAFDADIQSCIDQRLICLRW